MRKNVIDPILSSISLSKQRIGSTVSDSYKNLKTVLKDQTGVPGQLALTGAKKLAPGLVVAGAYDYLTSPDKEKEKKKQSDRDEEMKKIGREEASAKFLGNKTEKELKKEEEETNKKAESIKKQLAEIENQKKQRQENLKREQEVEAKKQQLILKQKEIDKAKKEQETEKQNQNTPVQIAKKPEDKSPTQPLPVMTGSGTHPEILDKINQYKYHLGGAGLAALGGLGYVAYKKYKKKKQRGGK